MDQLRLRSNNRIQRTSLAYQRDELDKFDWSVRLMGIKGPRGVGKTTLLLQHLKKSHGLSQKAIFLSLDDIFFSETRLISVVESFVREGGLFLYLDEVHKYSDWAIEIKNLYDTYSQLQIFFTGSSMLEIQKGKADLSRRAIIFNLQGLSFRQYLGIKNNISLPIYGLDDILTQGNEIISSLPEGLLPYPDFREYLKLGYYPFFMEGEKWFFDRLTATIQVVIESEFLTLKSIDPQNVKSIYKLLLAIASSPPFKPNIQRLSERTGLSRNTITNYLHALEDADILSLLQVEGKGLRRLQKPDKLYLSNTNILYALAPEQVHIGMVRETFVLNQLRAQYQVFYPTAGDFIVDGKFTLEVGGASKNQKQISGVSDAFIIADNLDYVIGNKIPIWLLGLMY